MATAVSQSGTTRMLGQSSTTAPGLDRRPSCNYRCSRSNIRGYTSPSAVPERVFSGKHCSSSSSGVVAAAGLDAKSRSSISISMTKNACRGVSTHVRLPLIGSGQCCTVRCSNLPVESTNSRGFGSNHGLKNLRWTEEDVQELSGNSETTVSGRKRRRAAITSIMIRALSEDMEANPSQLEGASDDQAHGQGFINNTLTDVVLEIEARPQPISAASFANSSNNNQLSMEIVMGGGSTSEAQVMAAPRTYHPKLVWFAKSEEEENKYLDRAINATLTGAAVSYAITKIVTVDHDYWQGWTVFEILKYAPLHNWKAYEEVLKVNPVLAKMMISGIVYSIGDWIGQCVEGKPVLEFSRVRLLRSGLVGFCLHGSLSHYYYYVCEYLFPYNGWWVVPLKVAFDQTIWSAIWNSIYYVTLGLLRLESPARIWKDLTATFFPLLTAGWKLWPFAHLVTYGLIPVEQRLLWVDCVEIVWVTILSMFANEKAEQRLESGENNPETVLLLSSDTVEENMTNES